MGQLPNNRIPNNKYRRNEGNRKLPLSNHNNNYCREESLMNTKTRGQSMMRNQIFAYSKHLPKRYLLITKGKVVDLQWRNLTDTMETK